MLIPSFPHSEHFVLQTMHELSFVCLTRDDLGWYDNDYRIARLNHHHMRRIASAYFNTMTTCFAPSIVWTEEDMKKSHRNELPEITFVELRLETADAANFERWATDNQGKFWAFMEEMGEAGYKFSISPDLDNACYIATFTGTKHAARNTGKCMTSRADGPFEAAMMGLYKHMVLCNSGDWGEGRSTKSWG